MFKSKIIYIFLLTVILLANRGDIFAQEKFSATQDATPSASESYVLFWPVVAGKTMDDKLFFLKEWKETFKGMFVFGESERADYAVHLSTKRIIETEKLLNNKKNIYALKSLEKAKEYLVFAKEKLQIAKEKNEFDRNSINNIENQIGNLDMFLVRLKTNTSNDVQTQIDEVQALVNDINIALR